MPDTVAVVTFLPCPQMRSESWLPSFPLKWGWESGFGDIYFQLRKSGARLSWREPAGPLTAAPLGLKRT